MVSREVIKFIKKEDIIQEFVSRGSRLPIIKIEDMLQKFKDSKEKRIIKLIDNLNTYNAITEDDCVLIKDLKNALSRSND